MRAPDEQTGAKATALEALRAQLKRGSERGPADPNANVLDTLTGDMRAGFARIGSDGKAARPEQKGGEDERQVA